VFQKWTKSWQGRAYQAKGKGANLRGKLDAKTAGKSTHTIVQGPNQEKIAKSKQ